MKNNVFRGFRFEIILYSLLSLLYSILTEVVLFAIFYFFRRLINQIEQKSNPQYIGLKNVNENLALNRGTSEEITNNINNSIDYLKQHDNPFHRYMILIAIIAIIVGIVLFIFYFLLLTKKFSDYLEEIAMGINEISSGDFNYRIDIRNEDEFSFIANRLNQMADDVRVIMENERKSENIKNDLVVSVAHDIRTPLTSIIGYLELVSKDERLSDENKIRYVEIAYNKARRLEKMIEDLFAYTKLSFGEVTMNRTKIDLVKFIEQLVDEFYPSFQDSNLEYDFTTNVNRIVISADGDLLARAFANLISNAIKYGKDGKRVRIKLVKGTEGVTIKVVNYGELIPKRDLEHIFERFYRVESSRSRETGGSGLGLTIAKSIILMHKGTISAKSDFDGTVFEVTFKNELLEHIELEED